MVLSALWYPLQWYSNILTVSDMSSLLLHPKLVHLYLMFGFVFYTVAHTHVYGCKSKVQVNIRAMGGAREGPAGASAPPRKTKAPR